MTETNEVEFHEAVGGTGGPGGPGGRSPAIRAGMVAGAALLVVVGAVAAMGASPAPSTGAAPAASAAPGATTPSGKPSWGGLKGAFGLRGGELGIGGFRDITISAISGSDLSLKTADGWTRTISVTDSTTITKGGATIAVGDLAVGDQVRFGQQKATDGSYSITAIVVVLPTIAGQVSAIDGSTITVTQPGGTTAKIHVSGSTKFQVNGAAGSLSDLKVGAFIVAEGTQGSDGTLDAAAVHSGFGGRHGPRGPGFPGDHDGESSPNASPAPSSGTS
jgi:hypothetical protein